MKKLIGKFSVVIFAGLLCFATSAFASGFGPGQGNGGGSGCSNHQQQSNGGWGWGGGGNGGGGCTTVPEGGTTLMYVLLAGVGCAGALALRSRRKAATQEIK
ncbi:MAG: hypothetical protein WAM78_20495 [Candidatus Sulfotelmatobacter sp.]